MLVACGGGDDDYSLKVQQRFVDECAAVTDRDTCTCLYHRIEQEVPYETFADYDRKRAEDPDFVPPEFQELAIECSAQALPGSGG